ncbi:hypothetical protein EDD15DRAFT_991787 [Pisolithus albus]|nr:hypothetical protein EDD15DRAFT_991787 [Pisolithus albus]
MYVSVFFVFFSRFHLVTSYLQLGRTKKKNGSADHPWNETKTKNYMLYKILGTMNTVASNRRPIKLKKKVTKAQPPRQTRAMYVYIRSWRTCNPEHVSH